MTPHSITPRPIDRMKKSEFVGLCRAIWGPYWKRPAARALGRDPKMMRRYESGDSPVPTDVAHRLRALAKIGPAGEIVKSVLLELYAAPARHAPGTVKRGALEQAHNAAAQIVDKLNRAGLLRSLEE
jgi:hypothetical protein